jgi:hypothetical protein
MPEVEVVESDAMACCPSLLLSLPGIYLDLARIQGHLAWQLGEQQLPRESDGDRRKAPTAKMVASVSPWGARVEEAFGGGNHSIWPGPQILRGKLVAHVFW